MARVIYPSADELVETNERVLEQIQAKRADRHGVPSRKKLEESIDKAKSEEGDLYDKASVLLIELVRGHAFASGVRRTAYAATMSFPRVNGERPSVSHDPEVLTGIRD